MTKTKDVQQTVMFSTTPDMLYKAIMDSKTHAKWSGEPAKISQKIGGVSLAYGDYITSINLNLEKDKRIVQAWRGKDWPEGHYSIVCYEFKPTKKGTTLTFTHIGIPLKEVKHIDDGWVKSYWDPIKKLLEQNG